MDVCGNMTDDGVEHHIRSFVAGIDNIIEHETVRSRHFRLSPAGYRQHAPITGSDRFMMRNAPSRSVFGKPMSHDVKHANQKIDHCTLSNFLIFCLASAFKAVETQNINTFKY